MESAGTAAGGNMRSCFSDFDVKNAAELEAHINMNAIAAKLNFDKYYSERLQDVSKLWRDQKRRLDVREPLVIPSILIDLNTTRKFDYGAIPTIFDEELAKREQQAAERAKASESGEMLLHMRGGKAGDEPIKFVLKGVDYSNVELVVSAIKGMTNLVRLQLADNGLEPDDCGSLAVLIRDCKSLTTLDLSNNKLAAEGVQKLCTALLESDSAITDLDLGANTLSRSAGKALGELLKDPRCKLERLQLAGNQLGIYGTEEIASGLVGNRTLKSLGLQNNNVGNDGAQKLIDCLTPKGSPIGVVVEGKNCSLIQVNLDSNRVDDPLVAQVAASLWLNDQIQVRAHMVKLEADNRRGVEASCDGELQLIQLLWEKATDELKAKLEAAAVAKAKAQAKAGGVKSTSPAKGGAKGVPAPAPKGAKGAPAPASSAKVKAAASTKSPAPAPKAPAKAPAKKPSAK